MSLRRYASASHPLMASHIIHVRNRKMADIIPIDAAPKLKRTRSKLSSLNIDEGEIGNRIHDFYQNAHQARTDEIDARLQRYAKTRMWTEGRDWPWENACFSLDSELLTANGWKPVGEMGVGDCVYTRSPDGTAEYRPVAKVIRTTSASAISFKGKSIDLLVTPNHRMLIEDWAGRTKFVMAAEFVGLSNKGWSIPLTSKWKGESPEVISGLPAKEYLRLLGWYIAEGSQNNGGTLAITQSKTANAEKCLIIERDLENAGITWNYNRTDYYLHSMTVAQPALNELRSLGVCNEKLLPDHVLDLSPELLNELLDAMLLGDGHFKENGHRIYTTTSRMLADQVQEIAQKIGLRARIIKREPMPGGAVDGRQIIGALPIYLVNINSKATVQVRKINVREELFDEPVEFACVNVPPHNTLYVRRNGIAVWCGNTDAAIPDILTAVMKMQDTLHNAVMSQSPPIMAKATKKPDREKEDTVNQLVNYQFFSEQPGEEIIGTLAHDFVIEGFWTAYVPWVRETRSVVDVKRIPPIPDQMQPIDYFRQFVEGTYPHAIAKPSQDGWDWTVTVENEKKAHKISFFTRTEGDEIEVEIEKEGVRYEGPRVIPKDIQDVLHPARCENLQIPGPSNPMGASYVILRDYPTIDEIKRLQSSGFYDLMSQDDADKLISAVMDRDYTQREQQKDIMQGVIDWKDDYKEAKSHKPLTRLMVFDCYDIDGDGQDEDVIWWMILETKTVLRAKYLTQMFPAEIPYRPLAEAHLFPVPGRRFSVGMPEMMEGLHDLQKQVFDQTGDAGTISNSPFFFYRATSSMRPEVIRLWPGEGYPVSDPRNDVSFPQIGNPNQSFGFNMVTMINAMEEKLTNIGDLQMGRVPQGKASALRTVTGMQTVMAQGDARPERVLRRFFMGLAQIWKIMHTLNQAFLPLHKQYLISGYESPEEDPYGVIEKRDQITGAFMFSFSANALNTSKEAMQGSLQTLMGTYISPLNLQLKIIDADGIYRLQRDFGKANGQDPDRYLTPPSPEADQPKVFFEEALTALINGQMPHGEPAEGAQVQFQKLTEFVHSDEFGHVPPQYTPLFKQYLEQMAQKVAQEQQQQQLMLAAQQHQQGMQPQGMPGPQGMPQPGAGQLPDAGGGLIDKSLPGAGGGSNPGPGAPQ